MAFVPVPTTYTVGNSITLRLNATSSSDNINSTSFRFYITVNNYSMEIGSTYGSAVLTTQLSDTVIAFILEISKSDRTSTSDTWASWYATANNVPTLTHAKITVTVPLSIYYPKLSATPVFKDTLQTTKTLTGDENKIVLNGSTLSVTANIVNNVPDPTPIIYWSVKNGSQIVEGDGFSINVSITEPTSSAITIKVVNGRAVNRTYEYTMPSIVEYKPPTISITSLARSTSDLTKVNIKYKISMFTGNFGAEDNTATVITKSGVLDGGSVSTWIDAKTNTGVAGSSLTVSNLGTYAENSEYGFKASLQDKVSTAVASQVNLPVALPVLALSPTKLDIFGDIHTHNRNNTVPYYVEMGMGSAGGIFRIRGISDSTIANYMYLYPNRAEFNSDIRADGVYLLSSLFYTAGDTYHIADSTPMTAYITTTTTTIRIAVPVPKSLKRVSSVTVTACTGAIISPQAVGVTGYLNVPSATSAGSHQTDWLNASDVSVSASIANERLVKVTLIGAGAFYNATNNRPLIYAPSFDGLTLSFS